MPRNISIMKKLFIIILTIVSFFNNENDKEILNKTVSNLNSIKAIEYNLVTTDYIKEKNKNEVDSTYCYFDFSSTDTLIGSKYHFKYSNNDENFFNGKQKIIIINEKEIVLYDNQPDKRGLIGAKSLNPSIFTLKKVIPKLISDPTILITRTNDSIINNDECYQFKIEMNGKYIDLGGAIMNFDNGNNESLNYHLFISKKTYLPLQFGTILKNNGGYQMSTFNELKKVAPKNDSLLNLKRAPRGFLKITFSEYFKGMRTKNNDKVGKKAVNWVLPMVQGDSIQLSKLNNKLTLLEFWFPYCKGCVVAVPELNKIQEKYKDFGLKIYGIEFTKASEKELVEYIQKQEIEIPTLYMGNDVSKDYGIYAAPTFVLIDKNGKIIYNSAGFNIDELTEKIEEHLFD
jgi:thiol-disulfide isomerase/thioredoxin